MTLCLGWFSPSIVKVKIPLCLWELKVDWDDPVTQLIKDVRLQWRSELQYLSEKHIHLLMLLPQKSHHQIYSALWLFKCMRTLV